MISDRKKKIKGTYYKARYVTKNTKSSLFKLSFQEETRAYREFCRNKMKGNELKNTYHLLKNQRASEILPEHQLVSIVHCPKLNWKYIIYNTLQTFIYICFNFAI